MQPIEIFELKCETLCGSASQEQQAHLLEWALFHVPKDQFGECSNIAVAYGLDDLCTDLTMRMGEMGLF